MSTYDYIPGVDLCASEEVLEEVRARGSPSQVWGDDGHPARPNEPILLTRGQRRQMRFLELMRQGLPRAAIVARVCAEFSCTEGTVSKDLRKLSAVYQDSFDDQGFMELLVADTIRDLVVGRKELRTMAAEETDVPDGRGDRTRDRLGAYKEARAYGDALVDLLSRRSPRWMRRTHIDVTAVEGGTPEEQEAVRRLLGTTKT
jgi:hypothetical protein